MLILTLLILTLTPTSFVTSDTEPTGATYDYEADTVTWENQYGKLVVTPITSQGLLQQTQYAEITWKGASTNIDISFRFDAPLVDGNKDVFLWQNMAHNVSVPKYESVERYFTLVNITGYSPISEPQSVFLGDIPSDNYMEGTASWYYADEDIWYNDTFNVGYDSFEWGNPEHTEAVFTYHRTEHTGYENDIQYYPDWNSKKSAFQYTEHNGLHYYYVKNVPMTQDQTYNVKWIYPTPKGSDGKWELLAKRSSDTIQEALASGHYVSIDPWWSSSWGKMRVITIDHDQVDEDLTDFPVYINITDAIGDECDSGNSIRFVNSNKAGGGNTTEFAYEIEKWTDGEDRKAWVKVEHISSTADTVFCMYYNNSGASDNQSAADVWSNNYTAVYHMNESIITLHDKAFTLGDLTKDEATVPIQTTSLVGYGQGYEAGALPKSRGAEHNMIDEDITIECWYKPETASGIEHTVLYCKEYDSASVSCYEFSLDASNKLYWDLTNIGTATASTQVVGVNEYFYLTGTYDVDGTLRTYINGSQQYNAADTGELDYSGSQYFQIGCSIRGVAPYDDKNPADGKIDEVRLSNTARSQAWIRACYATIANYSTFTTFGDEITEAAGDNACTFEGENPTNASSNIDLQPLVNVTIEDPEGGTFDITWQSNYTGSYTTYKTESGQSNGSHSWLFTGADEYSTKYYWQVFADDGETNASEIYHFTTKANTVSTITSENPSNESTGIALSPEVSCTFADSEGDTMNLTWQSNHTGSYVTYKTQNVVHNGTHSWNFTDANSYETRYYWRVFVDDGTTNTSDTFWFETGGNNAPVISAENPSNNSKGYALGDLLNVTITDLEGDTFNVTFQYYEIESWEQGTSLISQSNGSHSWQYLDASNYGTWYVWRVWADDGNTNVSDTFRYKTLPLNLAPEDLAVVTNDRDTIEISWVNDGTNNTIVEWKSSETWDVGEGNLLYNGTDTSYSHDGLSYNTQYFYQVWSWNSTTNEYSDEYGDDSATTSANLRPVTSNPNPTNNSVDNALSFQYECTIEDPEGDTFNWSIECNGTSNSGLGSSNGTKLLTISDLELGTTYTVFVNVSDGYGITNNTFLFDTLAAYNPEPPTGFVVSVVSDTSLSMNWTKGANATDTIIERNTIATWGLKSGTEVYNNSGTSFTDTGLSESTLYYYRAWGYNDQENFVVNNTNVTDNDWTLPQVAQNETTNVSGSDLEIDWDAGIGADTYVIVQKSNSYPINETDGTVIYNNTFTNHTKTNFNNSDYFSVFSYNSTSKYYSTGVDLEWSFLTIYVYREDEPHIQIGNYTVFITNPTTGESYYNTSQNNPFEINIENIPNGNDITIQITKQGYKTRTIIQDLLTNVKYNISVYLPPDSEGSPDGESGEDWYVPPADNEQTLKTTSASVTDPTSDLAITLDCVPDEIITVEGYNESLYGHWFEIPDNNYSVSGSVVTVDSENLDLNTTTVRVSYYCEYGTGYSEHYILVVQDEIGNRISDVIIDIKRYINTTDSYERIVRGFTDTNGQLEADLMPSVQYLVNLSHSTGDYKNTSETWTPPEIVYSQDAIKTYILEYSDITPHYPDNPSECVDVTLEIEGVTLFVNFTNDCSNTITDIQIYTYENDLVLNTTSLLGSNTTTSVTSFNIVQTINNSNIYTVIIFYNTSVWGTQKLTFTIRGLNVIVPDTSSDEINTIFDALFGGNPFGWHNMLMFLFFAAAMFYADNRDAGKILILVGGMFLFISIVIGFQSTVASVAGGIIPMLFIVVGIIKLWIDYNKSRA